MKKVFAILAVVVAIVIGTYFADKATRVTAKNHLSVNPDTAALGKPAPEISLKDLGGKDVSLAQYKGQVVLVNFWATWCAPCREEIPELIAMQRKYGPKGFVVLGVAMDEEGKSVVAPFVQKERFTVDGQPSPMSYPIVLGNDAAADKFGGLLGYPTSVLISRDGKQVQHITGQINGDEVAKAIEAQL
jgi:thiol-disulfide isomerase/thioredoxin